MSLELRRRLMATEPTDIIIDARKGGVSGNATNDAALMEVIYAKKWSKSPLYMTKREAEEVTDITGVFKNNTSIKDFRALEYFISITSIGRDAFSGCTNLALTELPSGITSIGQAAFYNCPNLALTELPSGITSIGQAAFTGCTKLALTELPSGIRGIARYAFSGCTNLALTKLPSGIFIIAEYLFQNCPNLALTELSSVVTSIGKNAFSGCTSIKKIRILNTTRIISGSDGMFSNAAPTIEVPSSLLEDYLADENWKVYTLVGY